MDSNDARLGRSRALTGGHDPGNSDDEPSFGSPVDTHRILRQVLAYKKWLLGALLGGALLSLPLAKWGMARSYKATAMLEYEGLPEIDGVTQPEEHNVGGMLQAVFIDSVLSDIRERMSLDIRKADMERLIRADADDAGVVRITATDDHPEDAADFANTIATVFLEYRHDAQRQVLQSALSSVEERMRAASAASQRAQRTYDAFREQHGIADLTTEQEQAIEDAAELRAQRDRAEAEVAALEARLEHLRRQLRNTPRTRTRSASGSSPEAEELRRLQAELARARGSLADEHPRVQALQQQIGALRQRIASGGAQSVRTSTTSINSRWETLQGAISTAEADLEAARQQLEGLITQARRAQKRLEEFSSIEGEASQLLAEVRVNQALRTELQGTHARIEDAMRDPASGFRIMSLATPPEYAERSKGKYVVGLGIPVGLFLIVLFVVLGRELRGLRVRTANELAFWGRGPVIGTSTWPRESQGIDELVADMDDFIPDACGQMLIVGATEAVTDLAVELAARLNADWSEQPLYEGEAPFHPDPFAEEDPTPLPLQRGLPADGDTIMSLPPHLQREAAMAMSEVDSLAIPTPPIYTEPAPGRPRREVSFEAWEGADQGPALRRAARLADRVCVLVPANALHFLDARQIQTRLGRKGGIGFILVGVEEPYENLLDRVGPVDHFWASGRT